MYDEDKALKDLSRAAHNVAYGGLQAWPTDKSWINDLEEAQLDPQVLQSEGGTTHAELLALMPAIKKDFDIRGRGMSLSLWLEMVKSFYQTGEADLRDIRLGAEIIYDHLKR